MSERANPATNIINKRDRQWHPPALAPAYKSSVLRAPSQKLIALEATPSELNGPRFGHDVIGELDHNLIVNFGANSAEAIGERIILFGEIRDENNRPVPDCLLEIWQANAAGRYRHLNDSYRAPLDPGFGGCGRTMSDAKGRYQFLTIKPGPYPWPNGPNTWRPAHIHFSIFGHAFAQRLITQMYFEGDPLIEKCAIVQAIPSAKAVQSLIAPLEMDHAIAMDCLAYRFNIVLRGINATPMESHA